MSTTSGPWPPPTGPSQPTTSPWQPPTASTPSGGNGLAIAALVVSGLALLVALGTAAWLVVPTGAWDADADYADFPDYTDLIGELDATEGTRITGDELEVEIARVLEDNGYQVDRVACPARVVVSSFDVVTCRSVVDGYAWVDQVLFESDGTFTLLRM